MPHEQRLSDEAISRPQFREALFQLLEARTSAESLKIDIWLHAVEIADLLKVGCTKTTLRHLIGAGYLEHAEDITRRSDPIRAFRPECPLNFGPHTCFVLTEAGVRFVEGLSLPPAAANERLRHDPPHPSRAISAASTPLWDPETREFSVGRQLLKRFTRPAPVLDLVLSSFQELGWPLRLDDPLPPAKDIVAAERLRDTVRRLNRCQNPHLIRFSSDGMGRGVRWQWSSHTGATNHGRTTDQP
jgi:hypothetical protein